MPRSCRDECEEVVLEAVGCAPRADRRTGDGMVYEGVEIKDCEYFLSRQSPTTVSPCLLSSRMVVMLRGEQSRSVGTRRWELSAAGLERLLLEDNQFERICSMSEGC